MSGVWGRDTARTFGDYARYYGVCVLHYRDENSWCDGAEQREVWTDLEVSTG